MIQNMQIRSVIKMKSCVSVEPFTFKLHSKF